MIITIIQQLSHNKQIGRLALKTKINSKNSKKPLTMCVKSPENDLGPPRASILSTIIRHLFVIVIMIFS